MTKGVLIKTDGKWWSYDKDRGVYRNVQNPDDKIHQLELALKLLQELVDGLSGFLYRSSCFFSDCLDGKKYLPQGKPFGRLMDAGAQEARNRHPPVGGIDLGQGQARAWQGYEGVSMGSERTKVVQVS